MFDRELNSSSVRRADGDIGPLTAVVAHSGEGSFSCAVAVERVNTQGGLLSGACTQAGALSEVPYSADDVMVRDAF